MPDKLSIRRGENITIALKKRQTAKQPKRRNNNSGSNLIRSSKTDDYLARRKKKTGVQFFDFTQVFDGTSWRDRDFRNYFVPDLIPPFTPEEQLPATLENWQPIVDEILSIENMTNNARLIEQSHALQFEPVLYFDDFEAILLEGSERFASNSFTFTPAELANEMIILTLDYQEEIYLKGNPGVNKFTLTPDFEADAIDYAVQNSDKIYVVPKFKLALNEAFRANPSSSTDSDYYYLNMYFRLQPRADFLDPGSENFGLYQHFNYLISVAETDLDEAAYQLWSKLVGLQKAQTDARAYYYEEETETLTEIDPADFPPAFLPLHPSAPTLPPNPYLFFMRSRYINQIAPGGFLLAIIVRGSQKFYCWKM